MAKLILNKQGRLVPGPVVCVVMDGVGEAPMGPANAVGLAQTPTLDQLREQHLFTTLAAHGTAVGMPTDGDMGNSEVGHNALGAGRIFDQGAKLVDQAIETGQLYESAHWREALKRAQSGGTLHFMGLISDGNVHSHIDHLRAMLLRAANQGAQRIRVHGLLDGRDVGAFSALDYFGPLEDFLANLDVDAQVASGGGRMVITMDRYQADWAMVERGWQTHVLGEGPKYPSACAAIEDLRHKNPEVSDQYLPPFVVEDSSRSGPLIQKGDAVIFFNFRGDRAIEISQAFEGNAPFQKSQDLGIYYVGMMQYDGDLQVPQKYLVNPPAIDRTLGELLAKSKNQDIGLQ